MTDKKKTCLVQKIENGTVVDHIEAGNGMKILEALKETGGRTMVLAVNVPSTRMGRKDIIKIEAKYLEPKEENYVALMSPDATIATIKDFEVINKKRAELPEKINGVVKCKNPACVSNREPDIEGEFKVISKKPAILKCLYCEREMRV